MVKAKLPNMEYKFDISMNGEITKTVFVGSFVYKRPTIQDKTMIAAMHTRLNGDLKNIPDEVAFVNMKLATLRFTLKEFPDWWEEAGYGASLYDQNVLDFVYNKCLEWEIAFQDRVYSEKPSDLTNDGIQPTT